MTDAELKKLVAQTAKNIAALQSSQKETDRLLRKYIAHTEASQDRTDEQLRELRASQEETDRLLQNSITSARASQDHTDAQIRELQKQFANMGFIQGETAEDLFYRNVDYIFKKRNLHFTDVRRNLKSPGKGEYDVVAINGKEILVVEVKNKITAPMIDRFIEEGLAEFRILFPEFKKYKLLGAVGALVFKDEVERYAQKRGLFVLTQNSHGGAEIANSAKFVPKAF